MASDILDFLDLAALDAAAARLAASLRPGDSVGLSGDLGAGKTTFVRALVRALHGSDESVSSPTFVFRHRYDGSPPVEHVDLYRVEDPAEAAELGLHDAFGPDRITVVEWPERLPGLLPAGAVRVLIEGAGNAPRRLADRAAVRVLGIDGALGGFSAAVLDGDGCSEAASAIPDALESGSGRIAAVLAARGLTLRDLDRARGRHRSRLVHRRAHRGLVCQSAGARRRLAARGHLVVRRPDPRRRAGNGPDGRPRPPGRDFRPAAHAGRRARGRGPLAGVLAALLADFADGELAVAGNTEDVYSAIAERGIVVRALPHRAESPARAVARLALSADPASSPHAVAPDYGEAPAVTQRAPA